MSAFKLVDGLCPDCGEAPESPGHMENEEDPEVQGDPCTHPCHDEAARSIGEALDEDAAGGCTDRGVTGR